jgi:hypothetical protein
MADLYADVESPLENPDLIALGTVLTGLACALGGTSLLQATLLRQADNYGVASTFDDMFAPVVLLGALFLLGCFLGAGWFWIRSNRPNDIVPLRVALGAGMAGLLGFAVMLLLGTVLPVGREIAASVTLLAAYYGARFTTVLRQQKPDSARVRTGRVALTATALLLATLLVSYKPTRFPGAAAPVADRHAWAETTFGDHYRQAVAFVKGCPELTDRLGAVSAIGPTTGTNVVYQGADGSAGDFTLEVVGASGTAIVHAGITKRNSASTSKQGWERSGEVLVEGRAMPLDCR